MPIELLAAGEVANILGVSVRRVAQLADQRVDFPQPYAITRGPKPIRLWKPQDIERWAQTANREPGGYRPAQ